MFSIKEEKEQKPEIADLPQKSSMEILSELFSTFHAEPPVIVKKEKSEESNKKHKKKKKHKSKEKKHKKKDKKRKRSVSSSSSLSEKEDKMDLAQILIKQEKEIAEMKIKQELKKNRIESADENNEGDIKKEKKNSKEKEVQEVIKPSSTNKHKIIIKDIKFKSLFDSAINEIKKKIDVEEGELSTDSNSSKQHKKKKHKCHSKKRSRSTSRDHKDKQKRSKIEDTSDREKDRHRRHSRDREHTRDRDKERHRDTSRSRDKDKDKERDYYDGRDRTKDRHRERQRSRDRYRDEYSRDLEDYRRSKGRHKDDDFYKREDTNEKWFMRDRYRGYDSRSKHRSSSNERDSKFDKKKLLEIARRNAITMMKSGSLPAALTLGPQAQEKVIAAIKSGGKTIEELTDFCKTLSRKEELGELSSLSEGDDSDSDTDKPFHHPFQIKDRPTSITMNIKNSVPLPVKTAFERTSELRIQFPVSSGQHHRKGEEWMPVSPPSAKKLDGLPPSAVTAVATSTASINTTSTSGIPLPLEPPPAPPVIQSPEKIPLPTVSPATPSLLAVRSDKIPTIPAPPNAPPGPQVFPTPASKVAVDIGSIISQRLSAMRKLQENPNDVQALTEVYKSNKEMQSWATSKQQLGQFTGSTGAQILSQAELSSGYQAWAKKDQLQTAAPVSGGMGMHLLQKMGWKPGEGLGKDRTGTLEPLLLEVKLDKKGLVANEEQKHKKKPKIQGSIKNFLGKHPVSLLGEYASKKKLGAPQYILEFECGPDHKKNFLFKVVLNGVEYKPNVAANNKKEAKAAAASMCLQQIGLLPAKPQPQPSAQAQTTT
ncbi:unnamed protein product [Diabrotica balteata]|uniref:Protein SON n=1 Tax=Diabrotica balteata TaxID=107213 RepID=A0A9N9X6U6_DIABA|nr:unnamed protein product [Diabrotica balteata]